MSDNPKAGDLVLIGGGESGIGWSEISTDYQVVSFNGTVLVTDFDSSEEFVRYQDGDIDLV